MLSFSSYAIFYAIYPELCYLLCHIPRSSAIFFLNVMLQYITLTPSYANSSYAMFSGQSWGRISGYCCNTDLYQSYNFWTTYYIVLTFFECYCWQKYTPISNTDLYLSYFNLSYVFLRHKDSIEWGLTVYLHKSVSVLNTYLVSTTLVDSLLEVRICWQHFSS